MRNSWATAFAGKTRSGSRQAFTVEKRERKSFGLDHAFPVDEETIHRSVLDWLRLVLPDALVVHIPNGGARDVREAAKLKRLGVLAGMPDLFVISQDGCFALEIKAQKTRISAEQYAIHDAMRRLGFRIAVVRGVEEARQALASWGIRTREATS